MIILNPVLKIVMDSKILKKYIIDTSQNKLLNIVKTSDSSLKFTTHYNDKFVYTRTFLNEENIVGQRALWPKISDWPKRDLPIAPPGRLPAGLTPTAGSAWYRTPPNSHAGFRALRQTYRLLPLSRRTLDKLLAALSTPIENDRFMKSASQLPFTCISNV